MASIQDFYTVEDAAREARMKYKTLLQRIARGTVSAERLHGNCILVPAAEVKRLKKERGC